jgi:hypothetical protein
MAVLMITVRVGDRSLPLAWLAEAGAANIGFAQQKILLDSVLSWLPDGAKVMLLADRFVPMVKRPGLALPLAPERQSTGRSWRG